MALRKDVKAFTRDRSGRPVRAHLDPGLYPKPTADLFSAIRVPL